MWPLCCTGLSCYLHGLQRSAAQLASLIFRAPATLRYAWIHLHLASHTIIIILSVIIVIIITVPTTGLSTGAKVICPDPSCHPPPLSLTKKISCVLHTGSLSCDKKQVLLNKPDVNNCWKQYQALRRWVSSVFCLAVKRGVSVSPLGPFLNVLFYLKAQRVRFSGLYWQASTMQTVMNPCFLISCLVSHHQLWYLYIPMKPWAD